MQGNLESTIGHQGGQSASEIARNLTYVEKLQQELIKQYGQRIVEMYRTMKIREIANKLLPQVQIDAAKSVIRYALRELMDPDERKEIAWQRRSASGHKAARTFSPEERARGHANRTFTKEQAAQMVHARGDAIWSVEEEQLLVEMMRDGVDIETIATAVSSLAGHARTAVACRDRWLKTAVFTEDEKVEVTAMRRTAVGRLFTDEERARGHHFSDADREVARNALGITIWTTEEDEALAALRSEGKKFRQIAEEISQKYGNSRSTAACISRYYNGLKLGTRTRRKRETGE